MNIEDRIIAIQNAIAAPPVSPPVDWKAFIEAHKSIFPEIESGALFDYQSEIDIESIPEWDDDAERWSTYAYTYDIGRNVEDGLYVSVRRFDGDCSWDEAEFFTEDEADSFAESYNMYFDPNQYFLGWAEYHLWCALNGGGDPLEDFFHKETSIEDHVKAAEQNVKYLRM
jgi:hypothetical protein